MNKRKLLIVMSLALAVPFVSLGIDHGRAEAQSRKGKMSNVTTNHKKGKLSKRNQMKLEQAEKAKMRREKMKAGTKIEGTQPK